LPRRFEWGGAARRAALTVVLAALAASAHAEAGGPYIPAALAIPAVASRPEAFVPDGFTLEREVQGDLGQDAPGVAQV